MEKPADLELGGITGGTPYVNRRFNRTLKQISSETGIIVDRLLRFRLEEQGFEFDDDKDNKSKYTPDAVWRSFGRYGVPRKLTFDEKAFSQAVDLTFIAFGRSGRDPLDLQNLDGTMSNFLKLQKSSGAPEFVSKEEAFTKDLSRAFDIASGKRRPDPCVAYHRTQHGANGPKTRLVWGYPQSMTMLEAVFAVPLLERFKSIRTPMAFAMHRHQLAARLVPVRNSGVRLGLDFSGFDSTIHPRLIDVAFLILKTHFAPMSDDVSQVWKGIVHYFIHTPIIMPDGKLYVKHQGVPSGSFFTQMVDSVVNYLAIQYCALRATGKPIQRDKLMVLGDDSILGWDEYVPVSSFARFAGEIGLVVNVEKSHLSRNCDPFKFLGHDWKRGIVDRPQEDIALRLVYPERPSTVPSLVRHRLRTRVLSYLADGLSAWPVVRKALTLNGNDVRAMLNTKVADVPVTGYQTFLWSMGSWPTNYGSSVALGYMAVLL